MPKFGFPVSGKPKSEISRIPSYSVYERYVGLKAVAANFEPGMSER